MALQTNCPACGAPLDITGDQEVVYCGFCGAELKVSEEDGQAHFHVLSQPGPQKEVLSQPIGPEVPAVEPGEEAASGGAKVYDRAQTVAPPDQAPFSLPPSGSSEVPPVAPPPYSPGQAAPPPTNRNWIWIIVAVVAVLCLACICLVVAAFFLFNANTGQFPRSY